VKEVTEIVYVVKLVDPDSVELNPIPFETPKNSTQDHTRFDELPLIVTVIVSAPEPFAVAENMKAF